MGQISWRDEKKNRVQLNWRKKMKLKKRLNIITRNTHLVIVTIIIQIKNKPKKK